MPLRTEGGSQPPSIPPYQIPTPETRKFRIDAQITAIICALAVTIFSATAFVITASPIALIATCLSAVITLALCSPQSRPARTNNIFSQPRTYLVPPRGFAAESHPPSFFSLYEIPPSTRVPVGRPQPIIPPPRYIPVTPGIQTPRPGSGSRKHQATPMVRARVGDRQQPGVGPHSPLDQRTRVPVGKKG